MPWKQFAGIRIDNILNRMFSNQNQTFASGFDGNSSLEKDVKGANKASRSKSLDNNKNVDNEIQSFDQSMDDSNDQIGRRQRFKLDPTKKSIDEFSSNHLSKSGINKEYLNRIEPNENAVHHEQLNKAMTEMLSNQSSRFSKADKEKAFRQTTWKT